MKVLFDHNLPHNFRTNLILRTNHEIITASYLGWGGLINGELLRSAEQDDFEVFVTGDQRLIYEQNLKTQAAVIHYIEFMDEAAAIQTTASPGVH